MKFVIIMTCKRSGSDLLQSLFNGHSQILQFPGHFRFDKLFLDILINYNYPIRSKLKIKNKYIIFHPFKFELIVWFNCLKIRNFNQFIQIPFFFIKRLIIFFQKNLYIKNLLPYSIGNKS